MTLADGRATLVAAVQTVAGVRAYTDPGANLAPPAAVFGLPEVEYQAFNTSTAGESTTQLYLCVAADEYAEDRLVDLVDQVVEAIWTHATDFAVTRGLPGTFQTSNTDLPCYVLTVVGPS